MKNPSIEKPILILACAAVLATLMHLAAPFLVPVFFSIFFAALLTPIFSWLKRHKLPTGLALLLSILFLVLVVLFVMLLIGKSMSVMQSSLESYTAQFSQRQEEISAQLESLGLGIDLTPAATALDPAAFTETLKVALGTLLEIAKDALVILMLTVFLLVEAPRLIQRMGQAFGEDKAASNNVVSMARIMVTYFGLRAVVNLVNAVATGIMLWLFGIPYVGLWVVLIFFLSFVPYIGAIISMIPPVLLAFAQSGLGVAILVGVLAVVINAIVENVFQPMIMGKSLSVAPTVVFLSTMFWVFILGGPGAFLSMPLTMAVLIVMQNFAETRGLAAMAITREPEGLKPVVEPAQAG
jgi:AI-2 transport protein TqsA